MDIDKVYKFANMFSCASGASKEPLIESALRVLKSMTHTEYTHKEHIKGSVYDCDCSEFVGLLLKRTSPEAFKELNSKHPLAKDFVILLHGNKPTKHWHNIESISDLHQGDIIAWLEPPNLKPKNTGHVMIVETAPQKVAKNKYKIVVIDSTHKPHGSSDSRAKKQKPATKGNGVGIGPIIIETDSNGNPKAFHISDEADSKAYYTEIAFGRVKA